MELVHQRVAHEGAGLTVSVVLLLSEGRRARSGLKVGEISVIAYYYIQKSFSLHSCNSVLRHKGYIMIRWQVLEYT